MKVERNKEKADEMLRAYISHPQKWNQYPYTINNPLRYTDPTGEEIWLRGTKEEIAEALKLLKEILGNERFEYVNQLDHNGDDGYALVLNIDPKNVEAFSKIGDDIHNRTLSEGMAEILSSSSVLEVRMDGNFVDKEGNLVDVDAPERTNLDSGYVNYSWSIIRRGQAVVGPGAVEKANSERTLGERTRLSTDGRPLQFTKAMILAHEIGHHWRKRGGGDGAVAFENAVRSRNSQRLRLAEQ